MTTTTTFGKNENRVGTGVAKTLATGKAKGKRKFLLSSPVSLD